MNSKRQCFNEDVKRAYGSHECISWPPSSRSIMTTSPATYSAIHCHGLTKAMFLRAFPSHQLSSRDSNTCLFREAWVSWEVPASQGPPNSLASSSLLAAWGSGMCPTQPPFPLPAIQGQVCSTVWWLPRLFSAPSSSFSILLPNKILTLNLVSVSASQRSWANTKYKHEEKWLVLNFAFISKVLELDIVSSIKFSKRTSESVNITVKK